MKKRSLVSGVVAMAMAASVFTGAGVAGVNFVSANTTTPAAVTFYSGNWKAFAENASSRKIYVPTESVEAYKSAEYWKDYADYIEGYDF